MIEEREQNIDNNETEISSKMNSVDYDYFT